MNNEEYKIGEETLLRALGAHRQNAIKTITFQAGPGQAASILCRVFGSIPLEPEFSSPPEDYNAQHKDEYMPAYLKMHGGLVKWITPTSGRQVSVQDGYVQVDFGSSREAAGDLACLLRKAGIQFTAYHAGDYSDTAPEGLLNEIMRNSREYIEEQEAVPFEGGRDENQ